MLTAGEIAAQIERGEIAWPGELRGDGLLLRLGSPVQLLADPGHVIDLASQDSIDTLYAQALDGWDECELAPGQMALCAARHPLRLGPAFVAAIASLSHLARVGLATHLASPWVMPGWNGHLTSNSSIPALQGSGCARICPSPASSSGTWTAPPAPRSRTATTAAPSNSAAAMRPSSAPSSHRTVRGRDSHGVRVLRRVRPRGPPRPADTDHLRGIRMGVTAHGRLLHSGYCLFMPLGHIDAVADAAPAELTMISEAVENMRTLISGAFGTVIVAEHGPRGCELGAGCCSHAHLHLIPVPDVEEVGVAYLTTGGSGRRLQDLAHLPEAVDGPYLYLSPRPGEHLLWPSAGFARQYVRRVCAAQHGVGDKFDWRDHPFDDNQALTVATLRANLRSKAA